MKKIFNTGNMATVLFNQNKKFLLLLIAIFLIIIITPTLYGILKTPDGYYYNGIHNLTPGDFHLYLSYFEQIKQGNFLLRDLYTGEKQSPGLFNPFFLFFGLVGKIFNLSNIIVYLLAKIIIIPIFITVLFLFLKNIFKKRSLLYLSMIFALFSSGLGVFAAPFISSYETLEGYIHQPMDLWLPEFNIFLTLYHNPLYAAALTLIILIFTFFIKAIKEDKIKWSLLAGFCALALFSIHPYHIPTIYGIPALFITGLMILERKIILNYFKHWIVLFLISIPSMLYQVIFVFSDFVMYSRYNGTGGPPTVLWLTIISYGLLFALAAPSGIRFLKENILRKSNAEKNGINLWLFFILLWFVGGLLLAYFPFFNHTRRLTLGLQIPLIVFSIITLDNIKELLRYKNLKKIININFLIPLFFLLFFGASTINAVYADMILYKNLRNEVYMPEKIYKGINWMKNNLTKDDVILTDLFHGNIIPGISGKTVYAGHTAETISFNLKARRLSVFFSQNRAEAAEIQFLKDGRITHIFYTDDLKKLGTWRPESKSYLSKVFENDKAAIYAVK